MLGQSTYAKQKINSILFFIVKHLFEKKNYSNFPLKIEKHMFTVASNLSGDAKKLDFEISCHTVMIP